MLYMAMYGRRWAKKAEQAERAAIFAPYQIDTKVLAATGNACDDLPALPSGAPWRRSHRRGVRWTTVRACLIKPKTVCMHKRR